MNLLPVIVAFWAVSLVSYTVSQVLEFPNVVFWCPNLLAMRNGEVTALGEHNKIVNGFPARPGQFPYQVFLRGHGPTGGAMSCGGSLIANQWILTAAHCLAGVSRFDVSMGTNFFNFPERVGHSNRFIAHPQYNPYNLNNDIALILLNEPVAYTRNIQPIALPDLFRIGESFVNYRGTVSGYGRTSDDPGMGVSQLENWAHVRIISNDECRSAYGPQHVVSSTICARGLLQDNQGPCSGDSGGPLAIVENGRNVQIGVTSFVSQEGCTSGQPFAYARVTHFRSWIRFISGV